VGFRYSIRVALAFTSIWVCAHGVNCCDGQTPGHEGTAKRLAPAQKPEWLDGSGEDLRIKVAGEVVDEDGAPAQGFELQARLQTRHGWEDLPTTVDDNHFQVRIPVSGKEWFRIHTCATSPDGREIAKETLLRYELRHAAIHGLQLTLKPYERSMKVNVVEAGKAVPGAVVSARFVDACLTAKTDEAGVATFPLMNRDKLWQLTAWTDDFRLGGYSFHRDPPRDPFGNRHTVELGPCRSQTIRIVNDENESPIADLDFVLTVGTGPPDFQYPGKGPECDLRTNAKGEAVCRWFPDWEQHGSYVEFDDPRWVKAADDETVDGVLLVRLRKSQYDKRRRVVGRVRSPDGNVAGLCVNIRSFQGEEENRSDVLHAFTDEKGEFAAHYLPDATYCVWANDVPLVSNIIDLIPYDFTTDTTNAPELTLSEGEPVEVVVTAGPDRIPVAHQSIQLETQHRFSYRENGQTAHARGGRRWHVTTDAQGKVTTFALPGREIVGSIHTPEWSAEESTQVMAGNVTRLEFHRKVAASRKITGRLVLPENSQAELADASVKIGSIDGETRERLTLEADAHGEFAFESAASRIGIYARTKDSNAAAVCIIERLGETIEVPLKRTGEFRGRLLGKDDAPLADHPVRATLTITSGRDYSKPYPMSFSADSFEATTDRDGNYTLSKVPCEAAVTVSAGTMDGSEGYRYLTEFYLAPSDSRPREISRLWKPDRKVPFTERYERTLRDCRLSGFHMMIILYRPADGAKEFIDANLLDYDTTKEVASFMQLTKTVGGDGSDPDVAEYAQQHKWPTPTAGEVFACAIDATGSELGRIELAPKSTEAATRAVEFVRQHAPEQIDAKKKWDEAFAEARRTDRKVWARISGRYCGPCFRLTRWLDDQKALLEGNYVFLKIDAYRDLHGEEVAKRLTGGKHFGIPFHAIFDADQHLLTTSESPVGNVGHPTGYEGRKHLRRMLAVTSSRLTEEQIDEIVASLED